MSPPPLPPLKDDARILERARAMRTDPIVATFVGMSYWPMAVNFLAALARTHSPTLLTRVALVCLDDHVASHLEEIGAPCLAHERLDNNNSSNSSSIYTLWSRRLRLARLLTSHGLGVIFSDLDAIWMADATTLYHRYDASVIASRGSFPASAAEAWGAALCMGFIMFKPTPGGVVLLSELVAACGAACHDQITINEVLLHQARMGWAPQRMHALRRGHGRLHGTGVSVVLLPHATVDRQCSHTRRNATVQHCYNNGRPGSASDHSITLRDRKLWVLRQDWKSVARKAPLTRYLNLVMLPNML